MSNKEKIVVLGAGVGGLAAGYFLARTGKYDVTVLEKEAVIGGLCGSFEHDGFVLDYGAHKLYSIIPGVLDEATSLMGDRLIQLPKKNRLYLEGKLLDYPLKLGNLAQALGPVRFLQIGFGYGIEVLKGIFNRKAPGSYKDYIIRRFGRPTYELVFEPLADKVWGDPATLHPEMARTRLPASGGMELVLKLLGLKKETADTNAEFFYYPKAGFGDWPQALAEGIAAHGGRVLTGVDVQGLEMQDGRVHSVKTAIAGTPQSFASDYLVSSLPLPLIGRMVFGSTDEVFNQAVTGLQFRHLIMVYVWVKRPLVMEDQWVFFPQRNVVFSRLFEQKQMNPALGPADRTVVTADFTAAEGSALWQASDAELTQQVIDGMVKTGLIRADEVSNSLVIRKHNFYPRYDLDYAERMKLVSDKLRQVPNLLTTGRIGMYNYNNSDHCADMGRFIADHLAAGEAAPDIWRALEQRVADYKIVD
ncbi:MAG TPA: FAD-dependent oxidoreductase [Anaerolineales bacterium]|nr:FAD-dependent oxidoreductase [Anaerolineales bacterium]HRQ91641.1 FAD-dependent oxidoreductase [Anaerolineales bacterium]